LFLQDQIDKLAPLKFMLLNTTLQTDSHSSLFHSHSYWLLKCSKQCRPETINLFTLKLNYTTVILLSLPIC